MRGRLGLDLQGVLERGHQVAVRVTILSDGIPPHSHASESKYATPRCSVCTRSSRSRW